MEAYNISNKEYKKLREYELDNSIFNGESKIYTMPDKWQNYNLLFKRFYLTEGVVFGNKLKTINSLVDLKQKFELDGLVIPEKLAVYNEKILGYIMKLIESDNLQILLNDGFIPIEDKIEWFKQIGNILTMMKNVRKYGDIDDFFLNDMHTNNFIVERSTNKVYAVDLDSAKIDGNLTFGSMMLCTHSPAFFVAKYEHLTDGRCGGILKPDENTDLFCYNVMILNFLFNGNILRLDINGYYQYLNYLESLGLNKELLDIFSRLYTNRNNENPDYLLDSIKDVYPRSLFPVYKARTR